MKHKYLDKWLGYGLRLKGWQGGLQVAYIEGHQVAFKGTISIICLSPPNPMMKTLYVSLVVKYFIFRQITIIIKQFEQISLKKCCV